MAGAGGSGIGQYRRAVGGDGHGVLDVRRAAAVAAADRPAVVVDLIAVLAAGQEPRLDRDDQPRHQLVTAATASLVRDVRVLVHRPADTVTAEIGADALAAPPPLPN